MKQLLPYSPKLKQVARMLRKNSTLAEILLWNELKGKKMLGYDFHRQKPIDEYVVDFYCPRLRLVIEIDGASHDESEQKDRLRQEKLGLFDLHVLRFPDEEIKHNLEGVLITIQEWIEDTAEKKDTHP